jgi:hypothetical protein
LTARKRYCALFSGGSDRSIATRAGVMKRSGSTMIALGAVLVLAKRNG